MKLKPDDCAVIFKADGGTDLLFPKMEGSAKIPANMEWCLVVAYLTGDAPDPARRDDLVAQIRKEVGL